eukprot:scaffold9530_cov104-Isochrysis_galbana.AAC.3
MGHRIGGRLQSPVVRRPRKGLAKVAREGAVADARRCESVGAVDPVPSARTACAEAVRQLPGCQLADCATHGVPRHVQL